MSDKESNDTTAYEMFFKLGQLHALFPKQVDKLLKIALEDPTLSSFQSFSVFLYAIKDGHDEIVDFLLSVCPKLVESNVFNMTGLHWAVCSNRERSVERLLAAGADVNATADKSTTALHMAARHGLASIVSKLINAGATVDCVDVYGITPLYYACNSGHTLVIGLLLAAHADIDHRDIHENTPIFIAAHTNNAKVGEQLLAAGANVHAANNIGNTPLHIATMHGYADVALKFVSFGGRVDQRNNCGITPLHYVIEKGNASITRIFLEHSAAAIRMAKTPGMRETLTSIVSSVAQKKMLQKICKSKKNKKSKKKNHHVTYVNGRKNVVMSSIKMSDSEIDALAKLYGFGRIQSK